MSFAPSSLVYRVDGATFNDSRRRRRRRSGQTLILFVMLTFALLGLAALIVDVGFARLARLQMQSATDAAALETLRFRDDFPLEWLDGADIDPALKAELDGMSVERPTTPQTVTDPQWIAWRDEARRVLARHFVRSCFDDDFRTDSIPNNYGAGPVVEFSGGVGAPDMNAGQQIDLPDEPVFKPELQLNTGDELHGDLVSGRYQAAPATGGAPASDYSREDFEPTGADYNNAALARLRRSNESYGAAGDGVASNGPAVPYLFGRGSLLNRRTIGDGVVVRATSIAAAGSDGNAPLSYGRVMSAGPAITAPGVRGLTPFAVSAAYWQAAFWTNTADTPGTDTLSLVDGDKLESGKFGAQVGVTSLAPSTILSVGDTFLPAANATALTAQTSTLHAFVPIYDSVAGNPYVIIGFGYVQWDASTSTLHRPFDDGRLIEVVVQGNASAAPATTASLSSVVLTAHRAVALPAFSPVLVNAQ